MHNFTAFNQNASVTPDSDSCKFKETSLNIICPRMLEIIILIVSTVSLIIFSRVKAFKYSGYFIIVRMKKILSLGIP